METSLTERLHALNVEALIAQARVIRDHPPCAERTEQAERYVRQAMYERSVGRITAEQESRIFSLLSFVMPEGWRAMYPTPDEMLTEGPPVVPQPENDSFSLACEPKS